MIGIGARKSASVALLVWAAVLLAAAAAPATVSADDETAWLFDPGAVVEIDLDMPEASIEALEEEPDEYQPATFTLKAGVETYGPYSVGARLKGGAGSFRPLPEKAGFKVKFDEFVDKQTFLGLEKLTLNNMVQDPSMVHETLAYELFRSLGVPASRTGYAFVRVNGEGYGVYLNVETLDSVSLPRWFTSTRHLYEGQVGLDVSPGATLGFEVDEGKNSKREDLEALIVAANDEEGDWSDGMAATADLTEMTRMWAVERYVGHWDGYAGRDAEFFRPNNYYLHSVESGLFQMLPWGTDQTWGTHLEFDEPAGGLLFNACFADASCKSLYVDSLRAVQAAVGAFDFDSHAAEIAGLLAPWQDLETEPRREYSAEQIEEGVEEVRDFIESRPAELAEWLPSQPDPPKPPTPDPSPASPAAPDSTLPLQLNRVGFRNGTMIARFAVPGPGELDLRATIKTRKGREQACTATASASAVGPLSVRCELSAAVRRRLEARWLKVRLEARFTSTGGVSEAISDTVTLPRAAPATSR